MAKKPHVMTPARKAALRKAQLASAKARHRRATAKSRKLYSSDPIKRGIGSQGLRKNFTPYVRLNKRSQTAGFNTGTIVPFTGRRIAFGNYVRIERTDKGNNLIDKTIRRFSRPGTKPGAVRKWFGQNVEVKNPAIRATIPGGQVRLGTSRGAGPTIIVRARHHQTPQRKSRSGVRKYDRRIATIAGKRVAQPRPQRRG